MERNDIIKKDLKYVSEQISDISSKLEGKTILLAGGAGFLGKYLVSTFDYLNENSLTNPCKVIVLDNLLSGLRENVSDNGNIKFIPQDISKKFQIDEKLDYIIHAASLASPIFYNKYKLETIDVGYLGTRNLLEIAKENSLENYLHFSSSEIYGNPLPEFIPTKEDYLGNVSCNGPRSCYDESKRVGEALTATYKEVHNIPTTIVRPFNTYGPGMRLDDGRVIANFVVSALKGEEISIYRGGTQTRTFCYIGDATAGYFKALLYQGDDERVFNIGNDKPEVTMNRVAELVLELVGNKDAKINYIDKKEAMAIYHDKVDPDRRCPDLTRARKILNYNPEITLEEGVKNFVDWAKGKLEKRL